MLTVGLDVVVTVEPYVHLLITDEGDVLRVSCVYGRVSHVNPAGLCLEVTYTHPGTSCPRQQLSVAWERVVGVVTRLKEEEETT